MYLNDTLQVCLLALDSRYPRYKLDINVAVLQIYDVEKQIWIKTHGWKVHSIIRTLEKVAPTLLRSPAYLLMDACNRAIYLPEYSLREPAFHVDCCGPILRRRLIYLPP